MKIKDIFKGAATAAIAFGAKKLLPEPIAKPVGTALSKHYSHLQVVVVDLVVHLRHLYQEE